MMQESKKEEPLFLITLGLAQRIVRYINNTPSPNIPVGEAIEIINSLSSLPQATVKDETPEKDVVTNRRPRKSSAKKPQK